MSEFLDMIREKTEEGDYDTILKSVIGGYSKKSVLDYLAGQKRQQQTTREAFEKEVVNMQETIERLQREISALKERATTLDRLEAENAALTQENARLQDEYGLLEKDMDEALQRIQGDAEIIEQLKEDMAEEKQNHAFTLSSSETTRVLLDSADRKIQELQEEIQAYEEKETVLKEENRRLKEKTSDERMQKFNEKIAHLISDNEQLQKEADFRSGELEARNAEIASLTDSRNTYRVQAENTEKELTLWKERNECLEQENCDLSERLISQMEANLSLGKEISRLKAETLILKRSVD